MRRGVSQYIRDMRERNRSAGYIEMVDGRLSYFAVWMEGHGVTCLSGVDHQNLRVFLDESLKGKAASYQRYCWTILKGFLQFQEHSLGKKFHYYATGRQREVRWISAEQMDFLLTQKLTPREGLMVCAGLYAGLRRCEVLRLTMADLYIAWQTGKASIYGKGRAGLCPCTRTSVWQYRHTWKAWTMAQARKHCRSATTTTTWC